MKFSRTNIVKSLATLALATAGGGAFAASTWDLLALCSATSGLVSGCAGNGSGTTTNLVSANAYSTGTGTSAAPTTGTTFAAAAIYEYGSGLGVVATNENSATTGPHATDNQYGSDGIVFRFGAAVNLNALAIGWNGTDDTTVPYTDSDVAVLAWTGSGTPTVAGANQALTGWTLVGNLKNVGASNGTAAGGSASFLSTVYSSYWLVSAYNTAYGGGTTGDSNVDAFKLLSVAGNLCSATGGVVNNQCGSTSTKIPEPGSLALLGLGLVGLVASRRRKQPSV